MGYNGHVMRYISIARLVVFALLFCCLCQAKEKAVRTSGFFDKSEVFTKAQPKKSAKYYIFIFSASWCGYCPPVMKAAVEAYPEMKRRGVEVILMDCDDTVEKSEEYVKKYNAPFPAVCVKEAQAFRELLEGSGFTGAVPFVVYVDDKCNIIFSGHGLKVKDWKSICFEQKKAAGEKKGARNKKSAADADDEES